MNPTIEKIATDTARRKAGQLVARIDRSASPTCFTPHEFLASAVPGDLQIRNENGSSVAAICSRVPSLATENFINFIASNPDATPTDFRPAHQFAAHCIQLEYLVVDPHHRGRGYAAALLAEAERIHTAAGARWWFTFQPRGTGAREFLQHHGWTEAPSKSELPDVLAIFDLAAESAPGHWMYKQLNPITDEPEEA